MEICLNLDAPYLIHGHLQNIFKRGPKVVKAKGWHRYDHAAPIAEVCVLKRIR